uniref:Uncharacterized protein n=1 Tax=Vitis vinifera TaxID=29760 RepID=F6GTG6_VITVI
MIMDPLLQGRRSALCSSVFRTDSGIWNRKVVSCFFQL